MRGLAILRNDESAVPTLFDGADSVGIARADLHHHDPPGERDAHPTDRRERYPR